MAQMVNKIGGQYSLIVKIRLLDLALGCEIPPIDSVVSLEYLNAHGFIRDLMLETHYPRSQDESMLTESSAYTQQS